MKNFLSLSAVLSVVILWSVVACRTTTRSSLSDTATSLPEIVCNKMKMDPDERATAGTLKLSLTAASMKITRDQYTEEWPIASNAKLAMPGDGSLESVWVITFVQPVGIVEIHSSLRQGYHIYFNNAKAGDTRLFECAGVDFKTVMNQWVPVLKAASGQQPADGPAPTLANHAGLKQTVTANELASWVVLPWKTGTIVGISELRADPSTIIFELATHSRMGHIGVVEVDEKGGQYVYESTPPTVQRTTLGEFLQRSVSADGHIQAMVVEAKAKLTSPGKLVSFAQGHVKARTPYNFSMVLADQKSTFNCSQFVFAAFQEVGITVGGVELIRDVLHDPPRPLMVEVAKATFIQLKDEASGRRWGQDNSPMLEIDFAQQTITPASIVRSPQVRVIKNGLMKDTFTDQEIFAAWGGVERIGAFFGWNAASQQAVAQAL